MKVIIAGSRTITSYADVCQAVSASGFAITEVVSGGAAGVDNLGEQWAKIHGIPVKQFLAEWGQRGKRAGYLRNVEMAKYADACIILRLNNSRGSSHMIQIAKDFYLKLYVEEFKNDLDTGNYKIVKVWRVVEH